MGIFNRNKTAQPAAPARSITLTKGVGPAVNRLVVEQHGGVDLTKKFDQAGASLWQAGLDGIRAEAVMILDHSGSMARGYDSGTVQTLVERALAFSLQIDADGTVPVMPFDSRLWPTVPVRLDNYVDIVNRKIYRPREMGGTVLAPALDVVLGMARVTDSPLFVVIVTDDDPHDRAQVAATLRELKRYPVFVKVLTLVPAPWWDSQDDLVVPGLVDNLDAKRIPDPAGMTDLAFADAMVDEWRTWIEHATRAGILH